MMTNVSQAAAELRTRSLPSSSWGLLAIGAGVTGLVGLIALADLADLAALRMVLALAACLVVPGAGWAAKLRLADRGDTVALAVVLSICATVVVGTAMAVSGWWSTWVGLLALAGIALFGFLPTRRLVSTALGTTLVPAGAVPIAGVGAGAGAGWSDWYADAQRRADAERARAEAAAREAAAAWADWYADTQRRAQAERADAAMVTQQADAEWADWYRRSGTPRP